MPTATPATGTGPPSEAPAAPDALAASGSELYPRLVGAGWAGLPVTVRIIHSLTTRRPARGLVTVRRGRNLLVRLLAVVLRLPAAGEGVVAELRVTARAHPACRASGQRWSRTFAGVPLVTDQAAHDGALLEFVGPFALAFRLHAEGAALVFDQLATRLGRPGLLLPWPRALSPRITGRCDGLGPDTAHVHIVIEAPLVGLLVSYEGVFTAPIGAE